MVEKEVTSFEELIKIVKKADMIDRAIARNNNRFRDNNKYGMKPEREERNTMEPENHRRGQYGQYNNRNNEYNKTNNS